MLFNTAFIYALNIYNINGQNNIESTCTIHSIKGLENKFFNDNFDTSMSYVDILEIGTVQSW